MPVYQLGNCNDYFNSANQPDWTNDFAVFGGNGDDTIIARALTPTYTSRLFIDGGNGDDTLISLGGGGGGMGPGNT